MVETNATGSAVIEQVRKELERVTSELEDRENGLVELRQSRERLSNALAAMEGRVPTRAIGGKRQLSPEARERIRAAQQKRWAQYHAQTKETATTGSVDRATAALSGASTAAEKAPAQQKAQKSQAQKAAAVPHK